MDHSSDERGHRMTGVGMDTTRHIPCPLCDAPNFLSFKVRDATPGAMLSGTCAACGCTGMTVIGPDAGTPVQWTHEATVFEGMRAIAELATCSITYHRRPKGWTCVDQQRAAGDPSGGVNPEYAPKVASGMEMCRYCRIRTLAQRALAERRG
jgi:hypothetical protein